MNGFERMPEDCPIDNSCGTDSPGYLSQPHPEVGTVMQWEVFSVWANTIGLVEIIINNTIGAILAEKKEERKGNSATAERRRIVQ